MTQPQPINEPGKEPFDRTARQRLARLITLNRYVLIVERALQPLMLPFGLILVFVLLAFLGFFNLLPDKLRLVVLAVYLAAFIASFIPLGRKAFPDKKEAVARLDAQLPGKRVIATLSDSLSLNGQGATLWRLHRSALARLLPQFRLTRPQVDTQSRDIYGLRYILPLLVVLSAVAAGPQRTMLLLQAFTGTGATAPPPRLDAWITPPAYTGRAPVVLKTDSTDTANLSVPQGSVIALRTGNGHGVELKVGGVTAPQVAQNDDDHLLRFEQKLQRTTTVQVRHLGRVLMSAVVAVEPDNAPSITLLHAPEILSGNSVRLRVGMSDDYGIAAAEARFTLAADTFKISLRKLAAPEPLVEPPRIALSLGGVRPKQAQTTTTKDLSEHPFAGLPMVMTLSATDDGGNMTTVENRRLVLPPPAFQKPLAQLLAGLRQALALDKKSAGIVSNGFDLVLADPHQHIDNAKVYLQITALRAALENATSDDALRAVLSRMWEVTNMIENGDLSEAERALKEAQAKLEAAIDNNASADEISKLMQNLRQAMAKYLQQLQQSARKNSKPGALPPNAQMLSESDLENMMKRIEELSRSGAKDAARQQLQALRDMLNALKNADPSASAAASAMQQKLNDMAGMMREQQKLMDETYQARNRQRQQQQAGKPDAGASAGLQELQQQQGNLREKLGKLRDGLPALPGKSADGKPTEDSLGAAEGAMGGAEERLQQNAPADALPNQGQALEQMRKGAQTLMKALNGKGNAQGGQYGYNQGEQEGNMDAPAQYNPFSDGSESSDNNVVPDEAQRKTIQDILDEVKRRLSEQNRPRDERDYLERLISPF